MIRLTYTKPNTIGTYYSEDFESYPENKIELLCENLANKGWELSEITGSSSKTGTIECTHDYYADIILIDWKLI